MFPWFNHPNNFILKFYLDLNHIQVQINRMLKNKIQEYINWMLKYKKGIKNLCIIWQLKINNFKININI